MTPSNKYILCLQSLLNSPGNFTASKLRWVQQNEPELYDRLQIHAARRLHRPEAYRTIFLTTVSGLSEGILWDFRKNALSEDLLNHYGIDQSLAPSVAPTCGMQGNLSTEAAKLTGLVQETPVTYRAGDQPNNALSLNTLHPGEVAATEGPRALYTVWWISSSTMKVPG